MFWSLDVVYSSITNWMTDTCMVYQSINSFSWVEMYLFLKYPVNGAEIKFMLVYTLWCGRRYAPQCVCFLHLLSAESFLIAMKKDSTHGINSSYSASSPIIITIITITTTIAIIIINIITIIMLVINLRSWERICPLQSVLPPRSSIYLPSHPDDDDAADEKASWLLIGRQKSVENRPLTKIKLGKVKAWTINDVSTSKERVHKQN